MRRARIGLVGAGAISKAHAQAAASASNVELVAICDMERKAANELAACWGARAYSSIVAMFEDESLDGVIVATPPRSHETIAKFFASRRIHVLCEKPLAPTVESARSMIDAARATGVVLTMASKFRFVEDIRAARTMIEKGRLGDILLVENTFTCNIDMSTRWNSDVSISGGGVIMDNGTHAVDIFRYLLGPISEIRAHEHHRYQGGNVEDTATLVAHFAGKTVATSDLSWSIDKRLPYFLNIFGTRGTINIGWSESRYCKHGSSAWEIFGTGYSKLDAFTKLQEDFAYSIVGGRPPEASTDDALASVEAIEAAYDSLRHGGRGELVRQSPARDRIAV